MEKKASYNFPAYKYCIRYRKHRNFFNYLLSRLFWFIVLVICVYGACKLIDRSYQHYDRNPTVITIEKNYRDWMVTFPAATFCFVDNLDSDRAKAFIAKTWGIEPSPEDEMLEASEDDISGNEDGTANISYFDSSESYSPVSNSFSSNETWVDHVDVIDNTKVTSKDVAIAQPGTYRYYFTFLRNLVNQTFSNMGIFKMYTGDDKLSRLNVKSTILKVIREFKIESISYTNDFNDTEFYLTPTEMGMCYVHGGILANYITFGNGPEIRANTEPVMCTHADTLCYARTQGTPSDVRYYIHSPYELPDSAQPYILVSGRMDRVVTLNSLETTVSAGIEKLSPSQRHCRFINEPTAPHLQVYSFNLCRMQCRKELLFKLCGCAPYFYTEESHIPLCNLEGLACLSKYSEMIITLRRNNTKKLCDCLPQCKNMRYTIDKDIIKSWNFPIPYDIRFRWAINKFSQIRLRRDVIYSFTDLVVSFGGIAAFFLGCSVLSFAEIFYFFTLRLFWFLKNNMN